MDILDDASSDTYAPFMGIKWIMMFLFDCYPNLSLELPRFWGFNSHVWVLPKSRAPPIISFSLMLLPMRVLEISHVFPIQIQCTDRKLIVLEKEPSQHKNCECAQGYLSNKEPSFLY